MGDGRRNGRVQSIMAQHLFNAVEFARGGVLLLLVLRDLLLLLFGRN